MSDEMKVEITPSEQLVKAAQAEVTATDGRGRVITLRKPGVLAQFRLVEALGESASNVVYMNMVLPLLYVAAIDGDPVRSTTKREIEALIQRLDEDGITAVVQQVRDTWGASDPEADKAALKN